MTIITTQDNELVLIRGYFAEIETVGSAKQSPINLLLTGTLCVDVKSQGFNRNQSTNEEGLAILNRIRSEGADVKISALPPNLKQEEAREKLRHERRIEFYLEGTHWSISNSGHRKSPS